MTLSLETRINVENNYLNLHNDLTLVYCAFPDNLLYLTPQPQHFLLSLAEDGI